MKPYWIAAVFSGLAFVVLFSFRIGLLGTADSPPVELLPSDAQAVPERDSWMKITQKGRGIGYSHTVFFRTDKGFEVEESLRMRLKTMGLVQDVRLWTSAELFRDLTLSSFVFSMYSGPFDFKAEGHVFGKRLHIRTESAGEVGGVKIRLREKPYIAAGIMEAVIASGLAPGETRSFQIFDPAVMAQQPVLVSQEGKEKIEIMGNSVDSTRISMEFKGIRQTAWIGENGDILRQDGLLGISMEKTSQGDALSSVTGASGEDLTVAASIESNIKFDNPEALTFATYEIGGIDEPLKKALEGGRQHWKDGLLTVSRESLDKIPEALFRLEDPEYPREYLASAPFIQSDSERIANLAEKIVQPDDEPAVRVRKIMGWIRDNIERRPVLSIPDALSTLQNRAGDCNEHSVLTAALARAAGVPAQVEAGVVYLNGGFYYHAWNLVFIGQWVTVDVLFDQFPADVTHIRFARGTQESQVNIIGLLGNLTIRVAETSNIGDGGPS